jgi:hypothetical protein
MGDEKDHAAKQTKNEIIEIPTNFCLGFFRSDITLKTNLPGKH